MSVPLVQPNTFPHARQQWFYTHWAAEFSHSLQLFHVKGVWKVVLVWGAACHEKVQEGLSQSCLASPVHLPSAPGFILDPRVQGSTVSNSPESLGTTEVPITRSSEASLGTANLRPDVPTPTASQTNHSQVSHQKHFCNYTALLNRCLLVTRFLFSAHLFLCLLTSSLLMLL